MNTSKSKVNNVSQEATPQRAKASRVSPRKLRKILRAVDRAARAWERRRGARFFPHPKATLARVVDMPGWRERVTKAVALAPELPPSAWATAVAGWSSPMTRPGETFTVPTSTADGGRPIYGLSVPKAIARLAAVSVRHRWAPCTLAGSPGKRVRRAAASVIEAMDAEVVR